jgi:hypothetical protein
MKELILHIGGPKCASSTIQRYCYEHLSGSVENLDSLKLSYFRLIVWENEIHIVNEKEQFPNTFSSYDLYHFKGSISAIIERLNQVTDEDTIVILSCEGWAYSLLSDQELCKEIESIKYPINIFFVVRPLLSVLNSSWFQWGAFSEHSHKQWMELKITEVPNQFEFYSQYLNVIKLKNLTKILVADISQDPVLKFQKFLRMPEISAPRENEKTHIGLFFQIVENQKILGRTMHNNSIEAVLNKELNLPDQPNSFFMSPNLIALCRSIHAVNMEKLVEVLKENQELDIPVIEQYLGYPERVPKYRNWEDGPTLQEYRELSNSYLLKLLNLNH